MKLDRLNRYFLGSIIFLSSLVFIHQFLQNKNGVNSLRLIKKEGLYEKFSDIKILAINKNDNIYLIRGSIRKALGKEDTYLGFAFKVKKQNMFYQIYYKGQNIRLFGHYLAVIKPSKNINWGWFVKKDNKEVNEYDYFKRVKDSLQYIYKKKYILESNGYFQILDNGNIDTTINFGSTLKDYKNINFDDFEYGLYSLNNRGNVMRLTKNADTLFSLDTGVFFIPPPGYGLIKTYALDSLFKYIENKRDTKVLSKTFTI